jgi:hypothetical protein
MPLLTRVTTHNAWTPCHFGPPVRHTKQSPGKKNRILVSGELFGKIDVGEGNPIVFLEHL